MSPEHEKESWLPFPCEACKALRKSVCKFIEDVRDVRDRFVAHIRQGIHLLLIEARYQENLHYRAIRREFAAEISHHKRRYLKNKSLFVQDIDAGVFKEHPELAEIIMVDMQLSNKLTWDELVEIRSHWKKSTGRTVSPLDKKFRS